MANSTYPPANAIRHRRRMRFRAGLLAVAVLCAGYWFWHRQDAQLATAYAARIACSCHFVAGRDLAQCSEDFQPGMGLVILSGDEQDKSVTAWLPFFGSDTARYARGPGCVLDSWDG